MELFLENSSRLLAINYFCKKRSIADVELRSKYASTSTLLTDVPTEKPVYLTLLSAPARFLSSIAARSSNSSSCSFNFCADS